MPGRPRTPRPPSTSATSRRGSASTSRPDPARTARAASSPTPCAAPGSFVSPPPFRETRPPPPPPAQVDELRPPSTHAAAEYKTRPCRYALSECPFAAAGRCQFAHGVDELRSPPATLASPERMLSARRFKTRLCKYFLAGHCPYAATNTCQFAHSNDELRAPLDGGNGAGPGVSD